MQHVHVVSGDVAGATLKQALAQASRPDSIVVLCDDLAVGPLVDVDSVAMTRSGFWQHVAPNSDIDFAAEMRDALAPPADLRDATTEVATWHGQSASGQLMLRRVTFRLHQPPQRINEVGMNVHESEALNNQGPLTTIGMYPGARLARRFSTVAPVSVLRIDRLAYEWQQTIRENADARLWKGSTLVPVSYSIVDGVILERVPTDWASTRDMVSSIMGTIGELLASDWFVFWRCRELVGNGQLLLRGEAGSLGTYELRCNVSVAV